MEGYILSLDKLVCLHPKGPPSTVPIFNAEEARSLLISDRIGVARVKSNEGLIYDAAR